jgi:hypothetical protein
LIELTDVKIYPPGKAVKKISTGKAFGTVFEDVSNLTGITVLFNKEIYSTFYLSPFFRP